jgi:G3E family GTPase
VEDHRHAVGSDAPDPRPPHPDPRLPLAIVTGFLGSGKSTLINALLRAPGMRDSVVIVNEFGAIGIDHLLVQAPAENMVLLGNGCLCCALQGDLIETLTDLERRRRSGAIPPFARVLVETSGLADPVPIIRTVVSHDELSARYRLQCVITLVDAVHGEAQLAAGGEALKQAAVADRLLMSKCDLAQPQATARLAERLRAINPGASLGEARHGEVETDDLFAPPLQAAAPAEGMVRWLGAQALAPGFAPLQPPGAATHDAALRTWSFRHVRPVRKAGLRLWLDQIAALRGADLLRIKGVLNVEGEPVAVHVVQTVVHEPVALPAWPDAARDSRIVVIARAIEPAAIERTFEAFDYFADDEAAPDSAPTLDPDAYARFLRAMQALR